MSCFAFSFLHLHAKKKPIYSPALIHGFRGLKSSRQMKTRKKGLTTEAQRNRNKGEEEKHVKR